ncbi:hypothetical protein TanjilG_07239 [Lupinus angustifolius]|uniref:Protein FAM33A n=1 Tax=Lupinus angustifolius TaxID=3871 RepID=A0A1J7GRC1_LUPAN|nr:PREDICTED: uncharacterized protein LOC109357769 [Lupinus angustifolius]OIW03087.1 hypothetical protein TanjilG_07239 [Lupinus angustifolius]
MEAMEGILRLFTKANHDLCMLHHRLEKEFENVYPDNANPMKLVSRIKKLQDDILIMTGHCHHLLAAKQDLIDKAQTILLQNRNLLHRMQSSFGIPINTQQDHDDAFTNFKQIIEEWTVQVRSKTGDKTHDADSEDLNKLLFSALVQSN